jgi:N4-gp56 family major capsid protein
MSMNLFSNPAGRINKKLAVQILKPAEAVMVLGVGGGQTESLEKNKGDTVIWRSFLPIGAINASPTEANTRSQTNYNSVVANPNDYLISEGVDPVPTTLTPRDVTVQVQHYGAAISWSSKVEDLYEDDIPMHAKQHLGNLYGKVIEMVRYGALKAATNVFFSGGTSRATVDEAISLTVLRKAAANLNANRSKKITKMLAAGPNNATFPISASWLVFVHTDAEGSIADLPGFKYAYEYAAGKPVHPNELGAVHNFRFIASPELNSYINSGATVGATGLYSTSGANVDVYPFIICGEDAWGDVRVKANDIEAQVISAKQRDKSDIFGLRGYATVQGWYASTILNQGWMAVIEAGVSA